MDIENVNAHGDHINGLILSDMTINAHSLEFILGNTEVSFKFRFGCICCYYLRQEVSEIFERKIETFKVIKVYDRS